SKLAVESFGTKAGAEFADAIKSGRFAYTDYVNMLDKSSGTVENTFNNTRDGMDDVKVATNNLKITGAKFGETIMENLAPIIQKLSNKLKELTKWFGGLDKGTKNNILKMAGLVAAIGPALIIIGKLSTGVGSTIKLFSSFFGIIGKVTTAIKGFSLTTAASTIKLIAHKAATLAATVAQKAMAVAQGALNLVMSLNPITLIIIAIVALVATIVILWNKCEWFRNLIAGLFEWLKIGFNAVISFFKMIGGGFVVAFKASIAAIKFVFNAIVEGIKSIWKGACNFIGKAFDGAADGIKAVFTGVKNTVVGIAQGMVNIIIKAVNFCIRSLNKISFSIPDWVPSLGGKSFGVSIKEIQQVNWLYKGGIIDKPTIMGGLGIGDAFNGTGRNKEAVVPLDEMYSNIEKIVSKNNITQNLTINSPKNLNPSETARLNKKALQNMALQGV
ncbi:MAG: phage tail tape measure protein, partial [Clostridia bacterium]